jgi:DNA polymerase III epsilon subunit-like protein
MSGEGTVLVCLDTETTGLGADEDVVQLAAVLHREGDAAFHTLSSLALPEVAVSHGAEQTHGYSYERLLGLGAKPSAYVAGEFAREVSGFSAGAPYVLAGHNLGYDLKVLSRHPELTCLFEGAAGTVCTRQLAHRVSPRLPDHQLMTVFRDWCMCNGEPRVKPHDALSDAWCVFKMIRQEMDGGRERRDASGMKTYQGLAEWLGTPAKLGAMPFGKHKGAAFNDIPESYLRWLVGNDNTDGDVRHSASTELARRAMMELEGGEDDVPF